MRTEDQQVQHRGGPTVLSALLSSCSGVPGNFEVSASWKHRREVLGPTKSWCDNPGLSLNTQKVHATRPLCHSSEPQAGLASQNLGLTVSSFLHWVHRGQAEQEPWGSQSRALRKPAEGPS